MRVLHREIINSDLNLVSNTGINRPKARDSRRLLSQTPKEQQ